MVLRTALLLLPTETLLRLLTQYRYLLQPILGRPALALAQDLPSPQATPKELETALLFLRRATPLLLHTQQRHLLRLTRGRPVLALAQESAIREPFWLAPETPLPSVALEMQLQ
jgi:hypothetical protein